MNTTRGGYRRKAGRASMVSQWDEATMKRFEAAYRAGATKADLMARFRMGKDSYDRLAKQLGGRKRSRVGVVGMSPEAI